MATKYDSSVNVLGSIPDYSSMIDFICEYCGCAPEGQGSFVTGSISCSSNSCS